MHSFVFFLVASLSTIVAKPLYGITDNSYNPFFNGFPNDAKSSVVEAQDQSNQFPAGVPVLPTLEAKPFEISAASGGLTNLYAPPIPIPSPQGVNPVDIGAAGDNPINFFSATSSGSPSSGFGSVANLGRFPSGDALFGSPNGGELVALEYKSITIWERELKPDLVAGENPCSGQDQNLGCCSLTYTQPDPRGDFTCKDCEFSSQSLLYMFNILAQFTVNARPIEHTAVPMTESGIKEPKLCVIVQMHAHYQTQTGLAKQAA
ncbi:hypothetical protein MMC22_005900 [Lobaria immixta]|nr:hypothetical protein [Lobaria immixta]